MSKEKCDVCEWRSDEIGYSSPCPKHTSKPNSLEAREKEAKYARDYYYKNRDKARARHSRYYQENKEKCNEKVTKFPEKNNARIAVRNAVASGKLKKLPCEVCGKENTHGHHEDYSKPLEVNWLCPKHHGERHRNKKLSKEARANRLKVKRKRFERIEFDGKSLCLGEWADLLGMKRKTLAKRLSHYGWSVERALTTPVKKWVSRQTNR